MNKSSYQNGFTLIELLLALTIFAVISTSIYGVFSNCLLINNKSASIQDFAYEAQLAFEVIDSDLENAVLYGEKDSDQEYPFAGFAGEAAQLSLLVPTASGLKKVQYFLKKPEQTIIYQTIVGSRGTHVAPVVGAEKANSSTQWLIRTEQAFTPNQMTSPVDEEILSRIIKTDSLKFQYGSRNPERGTGDLVWQNDWPHATLPVGVRMEITFIDSTNTDMSVTIRKNFLIPRGAWGPTTDDKGQI